jgi:hypothetical protein
MSGHDDDRYIGPRANFAQEIEAILLPQPEIEHDQARFGAAELLIQLLAPWHCHNGHVLLFEISRDHLPNGRIVIDNEHMAAATRQCIVIVIGTAGGC